MKKSNNNLILIISFVLIGAGLVLIGNSGLPSSITGAQTASGTITATVTTDVTISAPTSTTAFGTIAAGASANTSNNGTTVAVPMQIQNDGNEYTNISINALNSLWNQSASPTNNFLYAANNTSEGAQIGTTFNRLACYNYAQSNTTYRNIPLAAANDQSAATRLNFTNSCDTVNFTFSITVPSGEQGAAKSAGILFTSTACGAPCG